AAPRSGRPRSVDCRPRSTVNLCPEQQASRRTQEERVMSGLVDGKVAIVTGAAQGIGLSIAQRLSEEGAAVVVSDMDAARCEEAAAGLPGKAIGVACDVTS